MTKLEVLSQQLVLPEVFRTRYAIDAVLGQGGCGKAFRAEDRQLSRHVAIKILVRAEDPKSTERFLREGKLLAKITDRHVVRVYDLDLVAGHPYLVMELVDGGTLRALLEEGPPPIARALEIAWMTLKGLAACHAAGVVHRDLKPDNVLLTRDGVVKVADLGVARYADDVSHLTKSGELLGTPRYMAPEQLSGGEATPATDLHALGTIMFEMLSGRRAYEAQNLPMLIHLMSTAPVPDLRQVAPQVPLAVAELVRAAMARDPAVRPQSAVEMAAQLRQLLPGDMGSGTLDRPAIATTVPRRPPVTTAIAGAAPAAAPKWPAALAMTLALIATSAALHFKKPAPAPIPAATSAPTPPPNLSTWQDAALWNLHGEAQQLAFVQKFRRDDWSELHTHITPGSWDMKAGEAALLKLATAAEADARAEATLQGGLRGLPAASHGGPLEQALIVRLRGLGFVSQFIRERLAHYHRELPRDDVLDPEVMSRVDTQVFSDAVLKELAQFTADYPAALAAAVAAGDDARDLPGALLQDIARVSEWLQSSGRGGKAAPSVVHAVADLQRSFASPPPTDACRRAFAVASTSWLWGEVGAGSKASRAALKEAIGHLLSLERDLPRSRLSLEAHRRALEASLAQFERK